MTMVPLPKCKGEYRSIGIVEVLWKVCSVAVNRCLKRSVVFHDVLHGFREGCGDRDLYFIGQSGISAGQACTQSPLPSITGFPQGILLAGQGLVSRDLERICAGSEPGLATQ